MGLLAILARCCFICAAILAGMAKNWPVCLIALGLGLPVLGSALGGVVVLSA